VKQGNITEPLPVRSRDEGKKYIARVDPAKFEWGVKREIETDEGGRGRVRESPEWAARVNERPIEAGIEVFVFEGVITNKCVHGHLLREIVNIVSTKEVDHSHRNQTDWTLVEFQSTANRIVTGGRRRVGAVQLAANCELKSPRDQEPKVR
jgi:hypothetical protein